MDGKKRGEMLLGVGAEAKGASWDDEVNWIGAQLISTIWRCYLSAATLSSRV